MTKKSLTIATRESPLALWQANWIKTKLVERYPKLDVQLLGMTTRADRLPYVSLAEIGGKGLFVKELEIALLNGEADIAVHSMKDMPVDLPEGLCLPVMCVREEPADAFVSNNYSSLGELPQGAIVGTSSVRRRSILVSLRPDLEIKGLRGNVNTRLARLDSGDFAAIILAAAGLKRLGLNSRIAQTLNVDQFLPAPGQGVLGIECREDDVETQELIAFLKDDESYICVTAERAMCRQLGGGCQLPLAAFAEIKNNKLKLRGLVASLDGKIILEAEKEANVLHAEQVGIAVAKDLLGQGANDILESL